ncbi:MAG TPA: trifunctional transcriptional regulator/proline dehydrogenase/L-glutamate gamma-semialdehyde dehydrogenase, partial [Halieaceae bacterium]|nr:trifunctional transcriptional regulator/proline dehydrogenase/L-glutamate gamma-semialdehyde dehydrogenase [Halieaceae bacterium]
EPRGTLLLLLDTREHQGEYLMAIISALATGNGVIGMAAPELVDEWQALLASLHAAGLPAGLFQLLPLESANTLLKQAGIHGAMVHARSRYLRAAARALATREGPVLPLISCVAPETLLKQTLWEKSVSIDTTAAGGNASLMTMAS